MKIRYKHIHFVDSLDDDDRPVYLCYNNTADVLLCRIEYYPPWKQYVSITVAPNIVLSKSCHADIIHFMSQLNH